MSEIRIIRDSFTQDEFDKRYNYTPDNSTLYFLFKKLLKKKIKTFSLWKMFQTFFPFLEWIPAYKLSYISGDVIAGSTVAILNIPQAMAYAALAGVPAIVGLYSSFFPPLLYLLFGTSRHISLGMFAVVALMTGTVEQKLRSNSTSEISHSINQNLDGNESVEIITALTFSIGIVLSIMAICQIHFVSAYLSDELTAGFTTGSACHVLWSQIPQIFAIKVPNRNGIFNLFQTMYDFCSKLGKTNLAALLISACCISFLYIGKTYLNPCIAKRFFSFPIPFELIVVIFTTALSNFMDFHGLHNVTVVGKIPTGLPVPSMPTLSRVGDTFPDAIIIAIVIYATSFSVAKLFAKKHHYTLNPAQEVRALAAVQILSSFVKCHPASASLSRSMINSQLNVNTLVYCIFINSPVNIVFIVFWNVIFMHHFIADSVDWPTCLIFANASIIIVALKPLFMQLTATPDYWRKSKFDFAIFMVSFLATACWDVSQGLIISLVFALATIIIRTQYPQTTKLGRILETEIYRNPQRYGVAFEALFCTIFDFEASLLFVNCDYFKEKVFKAQEKDAFRRYFILDATSINAIDQMGVQTLIEISEEFKRTGTTFLIAGCNEALLRMFNRCKIYLKIERKLFFISIQDAIVYANTISNSTVSIL